MLNLDWQNMILKPTQDMLSQITGFIPVLIGSLIILFVGWIVAKIIRKVANRILKIIQFDKVSEKAGITEILKKGDIKHTAAELLSVMVYWLFMVMVWVMVINSLGLDIASQLLETIFSYIPNVIAALFVLILGMFVGNFISGVVRTAASNANLSSPEVFGSISKWAIIIFTGTIALGELGIAALFVSSTFNIFFGALCLALALAFGLGGRNMAEKFLEKLSEKQPERKQD